MKKRLSLVLCIIVFLMCTFTLGVTAATFEPDGDGQYTVELEMEPGNQYLLFVLKGHYDQTNYIEAFNEAKDADILYFEHKASADDGKVVFGPFVPNGYYDATLILGVSGSDEPYLAGHVSAYGVSNSASIAVSGIEQTYTVKGVGSEDYVIEIDARVLDSFGYPSVTGEKVVISLANTDEGVSLQGNVITISKTAKAQTFLVNLSAGDAEKTMYVDVVREAPAYSYIEIFADEEMTESINEINVVGTADNYPSISIFAKTFDQYGAQLDDTHSYTYAGESVEATFTPVEGEVTLVVGSEKSDVKKTITVNTSTRPDYKEYALELYNLVDESEKVLSSDKNVSTDGKDIFPEKKWTTSAAVDAFSSAVSIAKTALEAYGNDGYADGDYSDEVTALTKAKAAYEASFKAGIRVDISSIEIDTQDIVMILRDTVEIKAVTDPTIFKTTDYLTWQSSDDTVATVTPGTSGKASVKAVGSGEATITVTTRAGLTASTHVTVYRKATQILISSSSVTATFGAEKTSVLAKISPKESNDVIEWTYDSEIMELEFNEYIEGAYRVIEATIIPKANGKAKIMASAVYGEKVSPECTVTTVMPDWEKANTPKASVPSGSIYPGTEVSLESSTENATIYYTLDGTRPSRTNGRLYKNPIAINQNLTLKAIAVCDGFYDSAVSTHEYNMSNSKVSVSSAVARAGSVATVYVDVKGFENVTWSGILLNYASDVLEYYGHTVYDGYDVQVSADNDSVSIRYDGGEMPDGRLLEVSFRVKPDAVEGDCEFATTASIEVEGVEGISEAAVSDGKIVVNNYLAGDANDDGKVGLADVLIIKQYAQGKESAIKNILLPAADVDGDGDVDNDDAILVSRYCVGWDVILRDATDVYDYRIVSGYDIGEDADGLWRLYYDLYDPYTGKMIEDVTSAAAEEKAATLIDQHLIEKGTIVELSGSPVDENDVVASIDFDNLVWIKSADENELVVVPVDDTVKCKTCTNEYIENYDGTTYNDILGNEHTSNVVKITSATKFSVMKRSALDENFFIDASISGTTVFDLIDAKKNLLCYNNKSENSNGDYMTTYADYAKAFVCVNGKGEAVFVIVIANGNDAAAYNVPCADCQ